jgi:Tfp pilus assembly PilM family ATPase/Tfp pilus assembly protein PilN
MKPIYFEKTLGIDIRENSVCLAVLGKKWRSFEVLACHFFEIEPLAEGKKSVENKFLEEINQFLLKNQIAPETTVVGIPKNFAIFKTFHLPAPDLKSINSIIKFELEKHFIGNIEDFYYSFQAVTIAERQFRIHLSSINKALLDYYIQLLKRVNLNPSVVHLAPFSNLNLLKSQNEYSNSLSVLLDVGPTSADIAILKDGNIIALRTAPLPDQKFFDGFFRDSLPFEACESTARSILQSILNEIQNALASSSEIERDEAVETIYLFGGSHFANSLSIFLEKETGVETAIYSYPIENDEDTVFDGPPNVIDTAIGLGLAGFKQNKDQLNFLPPELRPKRKSFSIKTTMGIGVAAILLLVAGIIGQVFQSNFALKSLNDQFEEIKAQTAALEKIDLEFQDMDRFVKVLQSIDKENPLKLPILNELTKIIPRDTWLNDTSLKNNEMQIKGISASASKLIPILENSSHLLDAQFNGSIVKQKEGEKFAIKSTIKGQND